MLREKQLTRTMFSAMNATDHYKINEHISKQPLIKPKNEKSHQP